MSDYSSLIECEDPRSSAGPQRPPRRRWSRLIPFSALPAVGCLLGLPADHRYQSASGHCVPFPQRRRLWSGLRIPRCRCTDRGSVHGTISSSRGLSAARNYKLATPSAANFNGLASHFLAPIVCRILFEDNCILLSRCHTDIFHFGLGATRNLEILYQSFDRENDGGRWVCRTKDYFNRRTGSAERSKPSKRALSIRLPDIADV